MLSRKVLYIGKPSAASLNKRNELVSKCRLIFKDGNLFCKEYVNTKILL